MFCNLPHDGNEEAFCAGGLKITAKLLAEALHTLPDEKRQAVLLYYFFNMTDVEIAETMKIPRSAIRTTLPTSARVSPLSMFPASRMTV